MIALYVQRLAKISLLVFAPLLSLAQNNISEPAASPAAEVTQTIGISTVTVHYSRPAVKGRKVWGAIVPYGYTKQGFGNNKEAPWRAGANENTTIRFSHDAMVEGKPVKAGTYGLFFAVNENNTAELVLSNDHRSWGSFFYEAEHDALRAPIKTNEHANTELLTYEFDNVSKSGATLSLNWEKKQFPVKIEFDVEKIVIANALEELKGPLGFNWRGFLSAALYTLENKVSLEQGLKWANTAVAQNKSFATLSAQSGILKEMGKAEEANKIMDEAMSLATEAEMNTYGYQLINDGQIDKAIEIFIAVTKRFPKSANAWDSLGEAYFTKGDQKNAIVNFKKSLSMNPPENVKINSEKFLKQMNAL